MRLVLIFPTLLIFLDICAAGMYIYNGDIRKTIYWLSAAIITASVTY